MRMEIIGELRNLLAQGYLDLNSPDGNAGVFDQCSASGTRRR